VLLLLPLAAPAVTDAELVLAVLLEVAPFVQLPPWFPEVAAPKVIAAPSLADASQCCPVWLDWPMSFHASFPPEFAAESWWVCTSESWNRSTGELGVCACATPPSARGTPAASAPTAANLHMFIFFT